MTGRAAGARISLAAIVPLLAAGCSGIQSALNPQGLEAARLAHLIWFFIAVCGAVWLLVMAGLGMAIFSRRGRGNSDPLALDAGGERRKALVVATLVGVTVLVLIVFTFTSYLATRGLASPGKAIEIEVTGHQWWWQVNYAGTTPSRTFQTANEIRIPAGQRVRLTLKSGDVIHSFWVPNLAGKQDLIPGKTNVLEFTATRPGIYRAQCAEFCGWQHAKMALSVFSLTTAEFNGWVKSQLRPASAALDPIAAKGRDVFMSRGCALCHAIRGTRAGGRYGPDLTHVADRTTLAAGTLPNSPQSLMAWIADPQAIKPGNKMPIVPLTQGERAALTAYLGSLH
jgi:cytochrome c oxidase subunit 2